MTTNERAPASEQANTEPSDMLDPLTTLECDMRALMGQLSEARGRVHEIEARGRSELKGLLLDLVGVLDSLGRAFAVAEEKTCADEKCPARRHIKRFRTIGSKLEDVLEQQGVVALSNYESGFDPHSHTVSELASDESRADGAIIEVALSGYRWRDQILRKAEVVVNKSRAAGSSDSEDRGQSG